MTFADKVEKGFKQREKQKELPVTFPDLNIVPGEEYKRCHEDCCHHQPDKYNCQRAECFIGNLEPDKGQRPEDHSQRNRNICP